MSIAIRLFVGFTFVVLAAAFVGLTAILVREYETNWFALAAFDSQLFLFFPLFGVLALIAFFRPAYVMFDIYWNRVKGGRWFLSLALLALVALSPLVANLLSGSAKALWDLKPQVLTSDAGEPANCYRAGTQVPNTNEQGGCNRLPFLTVLDNLRGVSRQRFNMSVFVRNCRPDKFVATPEAETEKRYCFVNNKMQSAVECCAAQDIFTQAIHTAYNQQNSDSETRTWYRLLLPFNIFFLLLIFSLGVALVRRGKWLDLPEYEAVRSSVEARILVGALVMLLWPLLNHSFLQSSAILYGNDTQSVFRNIAPIFTVMFGFWALMLMFFYLRSTPETVKNVGQITGIIGSAIAFLKFDEVVGALSRMVGAGSEFVTVGVMLGLFALMMVLVTSNWRFQRRMFGNESDTS